MTPIEKVLAALQAIVDNYDTTGCAECGVVSQEVIDQAEEVLSEFKELVD